MASEKVNQPSSLPPYPEMIMKAIESLGESGGNKSAISKYIESTYGKLLPTHSSLMSTHLNKMKNSGEIVVWKNNFMKPGPKAPPKRGRGRPPKPKVSYPSSFDLFPPRPRGRPRKDPNAPPESLSAKVSSGGGRARGRPKKISKTEVKSTPISTGRPRGRPPKVKPQMIMKETEALGESGDNKSMISKFLESIDGKLPPAHSSLVSTHHNKMKESGEIMVWKNQFMEPDPNAPPKRGRGRPPKPKVSYPPGFDLSPPRLRGRPPKDPNVPPKSLSAKVSSGSDRPRGRPKKIARTKATSTPISTGRPRGRPLKVKPQIEVNVEE